MSKLTKVFYSRFIIGFSGFNWITEITKKYAFFTNQNPSHVFTLWFVKVYAFVARRITRRRFSIAGIFARRAYSQIASLIVKSVSVDVVNLRTFSGVHNIAVHPVSCISSQEAFTSYGVISTAVFYCRPFPLTKPRVIGIINHSNVTTSKMDLFHSFSKEKAPSQHRPGCHKEADSIVSGIACWPKQFDKVIIS